MDSENKFNLKFYHVFKFCNMFPESHKVGHKVEQFRLS